MMDHDLSYSKDSFYAQCEARFWGGFVWRFRGSEGRWRKRRYAKLVEEKEGKLLGEGKKLNSWFFYN